MMKLKNIKESVAKIMGEQKAGYSRKLSASGDYVCVVVVDGELHSVWKKHKDSMDAVEKLISTGCDLDIKQYRCLAREHT